MQFSTKVYTLVLIACLCACLAEPTNRKDTVANNDSNLTRSEPPRAIGIPEEAFWIGENGDGHWFLVGSIHNHMNNAVIKVYDKDGRLIVSKRFGLICRTDNMTRIENLPDQIRNFDGEKIFFKSHNNKPPVGFNN